MKKNLLFLAGIFLISAISFAQKKEIKKAEKEIKSGNFTEALSLLDKAEGLVANADSQMQSQYYVTKSKALFGTAGSDIEKLNLVAAALAKAKEVDASGKNSVNIEKEVEVLKLTLENKASEDYKAERFEMSAKKFYTAYTLSPNDTIFLFNAALASKIGKNYDMASEYFESLADMGYTGIQKQFVATNKETGKVEPFSTKAQRNLMVKAGTHIKPEEQISESKKEMILLSLAQIAIENGENEKAIALINKVRANNPKDMTLIQVEADMVYKLGNMERYNELMEEMIAIDPTNPDLYNNLGVASAKLGLKEKAIGYYNKALELKPDNAGSLINIAVLILDDETKINEEMNALGTSKADYARYDELKVVKQNLYREAMPYLESALNLRTDNVEIVRTLMGIYSQLGEDSKFKAMKAKLQEMEGGQ